MPPISGEDGVESLRGTTLFNWPTVLKERMFTLSLDLLLLVTSRDVSNWQYLRRAFCE